MQITKEINHNSHRSLQLIFSFRFVNRSRNFSCFSRQDTHIISLNFIKLKTTEFWLINNTSFKEIFEISVLKSHHKLFPLSNSWYSKNQTSKPIFKEKEKNGREKVEERCAGICLCEKRNKKGRRECVAGREPDYSGGKTLCNCILNVAYSRAYVHSRTLLPAWRRVRSPFRSCAAATGRSKNTGKLRRWPKYLVNRCAHRPGIDARPSFESGSMHFSPPPNSIIRPCQTIRFLDF